MFKNHGPIVFLAIKSGNEKLIGEILNSSSKPPLEDIRSGEYQQNLLELAIRRPTLIVTLLQAYPNISSKDKDLALLYAVDNGLAYTVLKLLEHCRDEISISCKGDALVNAASTGDDLIVRFLLHYCNHQIHGFAKKNAFRWAAENGHLQALTAILNRFEVSIYDIGEALREAAEKDHPQIIVEILSRYTEQISENKKGTALVAAASNGSLDALNSLLADPSVAAVATYQNNQALIEAQARANGDDEDRARYQPIVERLLQIPAVAALADQQAAQPITNLAHIAQFGENSMQSLNVKEQNIVSHLKNYYQSIYENKGFEVIRAEILSYLEEVYKKKPAFDNQVALPLEYAPNLSESALLAYYKNRFHGAWRYLSDSNPWMCPDAKNVHTFEDGSKAAIISDADKELLSYLWIAISDESVSLDKDFTVKRNKKVFAQNLSELNRAHNHDERAADPSEQEDYENKVPGIAVTTKDDLKADKPTCVYGVTKRLLESPYGHPHIKPLDPKIIQHWMEALLFRRKENAEHPDNIVDRLDKLSLEELENIQENLLDSTMGDEFTCHQDLRISDAQLNAFIEKVKSWYGFEEIIKERNPQLNLKDLGKDVSADSYLDLIELAAKDPMRCFATELNAYLMDRIKELQPAKAMQNVNIFMPSYDDAKKREDNEEPDASVKFRCP